jgi:hypothetical protein
MRLKCLRQGSILEKSYLFHTASDEDDSYIKAIALDEIYNFLVLSFYLKSLSWSKNIIKFQQHINNFLVFVDVLWWISLIYLHL